MIRALALSLLMAAPAMAQDFSGLARLDPANSGIVDERSGVTIDLYLSQVVPYRVYTLDDPRRLVIDFREVDWRGATDEALLHSERISDLRFGALRPGWSRMVADLATPLNVASAGMAVDDVTGTAHLTIKLDQTDAGKFAAAAGAPPDPGWDMLAGVDPTLPPANAAGDDVFVVVIDPGHGGIDPGAERGGLREAEVMLQLAVDIADTINRIGGMEAVLTRRSDMFVPLEERMTIARAAGADVFLSLHADALEGDDVTGGASVYTLSDEALDNASERMAELHDRGDLLAGVDLSGQDDTVATILMDLARIDTAPQSEALADEIVKSLNDAGAALNGNPRRRAQLAVLNAADFPSVLVEVGFLSNESDRARLSSSEGRAHIAAGLVLALQRWVAAEEAKSGLRRQ